MSLQIFTINTKSELYQKMVDLRVEVLLQPIGIPAEYIQQAEEEKDVLIVAQNEIVLVGCCILTEKGNNIVQLRQMAVNKSKQKTGLGREILLFAEALAKSKRYTLLYMNARDAVIPFYEKCGYHVVGEGFTEVAIPHHRMQKLLR